MKKAECIEKDFFTLQKLMPEYASIQLEVLKIHHLRGNSVHRELETLLKALHQDGAMETKAYKSAMSIVAKMVPSAPPKHQQALPAFPKRTGFWAVFWSKIRAAFHS